MNDKLKNCFVKEGTFKSGVLPGVTMKIRELTVAEHFEQQKLVIANGSNQTAAVHYAVKCAMVDPVFFTDEELKKLNATGNAVIYEVFGQMPLIGKTQKEIKEHFKKIAEYQKELIEKAEQTEEEQIEEEEKK